MSLTEVPFFLFLICVLVLYYVLPRRWQWMILLAGSYAFYAFAGWQCLLFLLFTTAVAYGTSMWMRARHAAEENCICTGGEALSKEERKAIRARGKAERKWILICGLFFGFGLLAVFKYTGFAVRNLNAWFGAGLNVPSFLLPMGLSFYVFQTMGYLIDVSRGKTEAECNPLKLALFVSFFPQLVQGPISRFGDLAPQFFTPHDPTWNALSRGALRVVWGYFKKVVVADTAMIAVSTIATHSDSYGGAYTALLILLYSVEIYGDFTGGIDVTIGIAEMLGIRLAENFDRPFSSRSTKEYWRRWHITMGTWFTDYVFYPLSVSKPMQKLSKWSRARLGQMLGKRIPVYLATVVTWFLTGLWHGADWNFIVWGLLNCLVILVSQELEPLYRKFHTAFPRLGNSRVYGGFCAVRTFFLMGLIRSLDVFRDVPLTFAKWGQMLTDFASYGALFSSGLNAVGLGLRQCVTLCVGILCMYAVSRVGKKVPIRERLSAYPVLTCTACGVLILAILLFGAYGIGYDASGFIYNQF